MKRIVYIIAALLTALPAMAEDIEIRPDQLPEKAVRIINKAFPDGTIKKANIERRASLIQYEVKVSGGVKLQFAKDGSFTECECTKGPVPSMLVPSKISTLVAKEFPNNEIRRIEHDSKLYEITLDDLTELCFNSAFRLIDIDKPGQ